ncbi:MAG: transcriptional repressor, partial [Patescibacteria group bacterium]|nr:transcriptional repressor [Patescibacteria group bacterium]
IIAATGRSAMDPATIYRFLHALAGAGIVRRIDLHHGHSHYELATHADHHHLICGKCSSVEDIGDCGLTALEAKIRRQKHFVVQQHALEFFGICARCSR